MLKKATTFFTNLLVPCINCFLFYFLKLKLLFQPFHVVLPPLTLFLLMQSTLMDFQWPLANRCHTLFLLKSFLISSHFYWHLLWLHLGFTTAGKSTQHVIQHLLAAFAAMSLPSSLKPDNGSEAIWSLYLPSFCFLLFHMTNSSCYW